MKWKYRHCAYGSPLKKVSLLLLLTVHSLYTDIQKNTDVTIQETNLTQDKKIWITIFVHGIMSVQPHLSPNNLAKVISDKVEGSYYYKSVRYMRTDSFFFKNQAMQDIGLRPIHVNKEVPGNASGAVAKLFAISTENTGQSTQNDLYYTFGWYGVISPRVRLKAGIQLYRELAKEIGRLRQKGFKPQVRVIGYSHGGNVALNMATATQHCNNYLPYIDELVLMGVPLQPETDHLVTRPFFKKVYNIFSKADYIQPLDCFSSMCLFSKRKFTSRKKFNVPEKLIQIQVRITKAMRCNAILSEKNQYCMSYSALKGSARYQRNRSPGHVELWFFGWTPKHYRKTFPLNPLPILAVVPQIIQAADQYAKVENVCQEEVVVADLRPDETLMVLRKARNNKLFKLVPFLSNTDICKLAQLIEPYKPLAFTKKMYDEHTNKAIIRAKKEQRQKSCF